MGQRRFKKSEIDPAAYTAHSHNEPEQTLSLASWALLPPQTVRTLLGALAAVSRPSPWFLMGMASCSIAGGITLLAYRTLTVVPPLPNCTALSSRASDRQTLQCAQTAAQSGELSELLSGLALLGKWTPEDPLYSEAQRWLRNWSESVLAVAHQYIKEGNLQGAIELANQIPASSPAYDDAQAALTNWRQANQQIEAITAEVHTAMKSQNWDLASEKIAALNALNDTPGRLQRVNVLLQQLAAEKKGRRHILKARELSQTHDPQQLGAAVEQIGQINPETDAWADIQPELNQWGKILFAFGTEQWRQGNLDNAILIAERIAFIQSVSQEAKFLKQLSQASKLVIATENSWQPSPSHLVNLMEAIAAARQIPPSSPFYPQAQADLKRWKVQLQDVAHLQTAQLTASSGLPSSFELAIQLAQQIAPDRPRRLQAQTLIAHWRLEIKRLEDRDYLVRAQQLAESGSIPSFQAAIAEAGKIPIGHPLRVDAQALIYDWSQNIETIEDQPLLDQARTFAAQGKLRNAIETATAIAPERALHSQAQAAIQDWRRQIRNRQRTRRQVRARRVNPSRNVSNQVNGDRDRATYPQAVETIPNSDSQPRPTDGGTGELSPESQEASPTLESLLQSLPPEPPRLTLPEMLPPADVSAPQIRENSPPIEQVSPPVIPSLPAIEALPPTIEFTPPRD